MCAAVVIVALVARGGGPEASSRPRAVVARVVLDAPRRPLPAAPPGLSLEYDSLRRLVGPPGARNVAFARLVRRLGAVSGAAPVIRIGGNSTDQSWWNPRGDPRPRTVLFDLTPAVLDDVAWLARATGARVTLGVNLAVGEPARAVAFARAAQRRLPPGALRALELGNEPDLYATARTFRVGPLVLRRVRKRAAYGPRRYTADVQRYLAALRAGVRPTPALVIGGFAGTAWLSALPAILDATRGEVDGVSAHLYGLRGCEDRTPPARLADRLLEPATTDALPARLRATVAVAAPRGLAVPVTELNTAVCGGVAGVSDRLAAALWLVDALFAVVSAGAAQVDVHTWPGAFYAVSTEGPGRSRAPVARPAPPYAGMLLFARAAPAGSATVPVRLVPGGADGRARAWATVARDGTLRVVLLNLSDGAALTVGVRPAGRGAAAGLARCGAVQRVRAADLAARGGIATFSGGRSCVSGGTYRVAVGRPGAALLTIARGR
jgi:hypothetical protein